MHTECYHFSEGLVRGSVNTLTCLLFSNEIKNEKKFFKLVTYRGGKKQGGVGRIEVKTFLNIPFL